MYLGRLLLFFILSLPELTLTQKAFLVKLFLSLQNVPRSLNHPFRIPGVVSSLVNFAGCGSGKYLSVNPLLFNIGVDRCKNLTEIAREKDNEVPGGF